MATIKRFEDFEIWQKSIVLAKEVYILTANSSFQKDYGFRDQIRRASVSISSNIAEGYERNSNNEFIRFLKIAKGSAGEIRSQLYLAREIGYTDTKVYDKLYEDVESLINQIGKFISYLQTKKTRINALTRQLVNN